MQITVALRERTRLAALLQHLEQEAGQREQGQRCDQRNRRTWRQLILGVLVARSTRLVALGRVVAPQRRGEKVERGGGGRALFFSNGPGAGAAPVTGAPGGPRRPAGPRQPVGHL